MKLLEQIPRNALAWIIVSLFALVAPHLGRVPVWVLAVYAIAALWRIQVFRGQWSLPSRFAKLALIVSAFAGIYFSYGSLIGLEPTVALLLTAFALKLTELASRKDAYVLLFLGYFICLTEFLFSQDLLLVLYSLVNVLLLTTALVALHRPGEHKFSRKPIRVAGVMLLQAMPLMVVLFFLFPRIGPLWTVPIKSHTARTGVSDFMKPGDISRLGQSDDVAFRARFEGDIPPQSELYWRGLVFSRLADGAWSSLQYYDIPTEERRAPIVNTRGTASSSYTIILEATQQHWLYGLNYANSRTPGVLETADYRLHSLVEVEDELLYQVTSWPEVALDGPLSDWRHKAELALPAEDNPRTRDMAIALREAAESDLAFVETVLAYFNQQPFVYTLQPPLLPGRDSMDAFLFSTRRGFCEHYAYAFVVMMRAAGIPARVVAGYQGGEINPVNRTVIVHQFDAHAWAEVWLANEGWRRVDPTAAVSPDRIEWGLERAMAEEGSFLSQSPLSPLRFRSVNWVNMLRLRYDALTYRWQSWVIGFNSDQQFRLLQDIFGEISVRKYVGVLIGAWVLVLLPMGISIINRRDTRVLSQFDKAYLKFCERLAGAGIVRERGETPSQFSRRAQRKLPALAGQLEQISSLYEELAYARVNPPGHKQQDPRLQEFIDAARRFRPRQSKTPQARSS